MCTMQYQPVCGTKDGVYKTYGNSCVLGVEKATYQHDGECTDAELEGRQEGSYTPPARCTAWFDGCNSCSRTSNGQSMCTLMACMGEPKAGYCRTYGETQTQPPAPPTPKPVVTEETSIKVESVISTSTATSTSAVVGFFERFWNALASWFSGLF